MARRRKKRSARKYMGAVRSGGKMNFSTELGALIGAGATGFVGKVLPSTINPKLVAGGKIVLGSVIRRTWKGELGNGFGSAMIGIGALELLSGFGLFNGLGATDDMIAVNLDGIGADVLGADDLSVINGGDDLAVVNGDDEGMGADVLGADDDFMGADEFEAM